MSFVEEEMERDVDEEMEEIIIEEGEEEEEDEDEGFIEPESLYETPMTAQEIDLDYEFDASTYFDLSREETPLEAREAEAWFQRAETYPPSPFAVKLSFGEHTDVRNLSTSSRSTEGERADSAASHLDTEMRLSISESDANCGGQERSYAGVSVDSNQMQSDQSEAHLLTTGLTFYNHMAKDIPNAKTKYAKKASLPRGSTLMKPTASQLAKQNRQHFNPPNQFLTRNQKSLPHSQKSVDNPALESQAPKRQKLEGGHSRKVADTKQQTSLVHKEPKKGSRVEGNFLQTKPKLTIPRQPDLETAHRAHRTRSKNATEVGERVISTVSTFRARPLNRKILQAPSLPPPKKSIPRLPEFQEFHLKTSERAMQHSSAISSTMQPSEKSDRLIHRCKATSNIQNGTDCPRPNSLNAPKQEGCEPMHKFKARPLNKKIFSSKGDIGVFRNSKRETTIPMEFNFSTDKRSQYHPPVELFNKLSLTSGHRQNTASQTKSAQIVFPNKALKENTAVSYRQERVAHMVKGKAQKFGGSQIQCGVDGEITEIGSRANMSRRLGIR